jgi:predicted amidohydrolase YtcJ
VESSAERTEEEPVPTDAPADLVLVGGPIHTLDAARSTARAIAVRDGRIVALGAPRDVEPLIGPRTRRIELAGRAVVPGFQDAHVHPTHGGMAMLRCDLHERRGLDTYLRLIREYADAHPDAAWITGGGWSMDDFPGGTPTREDLDAVVPDRPAFLQNRDGHGAWANSRALEIAGVTAATADPPDGRIERRADGEPSGTLHEGAMSLVRRHIPPPTAEDWVAALRAGQAHLHALGITAWQDAIIEPTDQAAYETLAGRGELTARVAGALWWDRSRGEEQIDELLERRARGPIGRFAATSVKIMQDGVLENFTGAMIDPYLGPDGRPSDRRGISFVDPAVLGPAVARLDAEGFQVHFHAIGDRAVREALDAVAVAREGNGWSDNRPHIAHIQVIHPADVPRFAALGVAANAQPYWAVHEGQMDNLTIPFLGPERTTWQYPFRSLRRAGAVLAGGSDWPVSTADPLREIEVMVNRVADIDREADPFLPDERLDPVDALAAFTAGSAWVNHQEAETGTLEVGKQADLVVLDRDILDPSSGPIGDARVLATWVGGEPVHEDPALDR